MTMYIIVGLGNFGKEYNNTRHNIGFDIIDRLAEQEGISVLEKKHRAVIGKGSVAGQKCILVKPLTYMNLSGESVKLAGGFYKIPPERVLVISDDVALPLGKLRIRAGGSAGGHNGLKNITELLGTEEYARMRFGVGGDFPRGHQVEYVLGEWSDEERTALPDRLKVFVDAIRSFTTVGTQLTMTNFNKK